MIPRQGTQLSNSARSASASLQASRKKGKYQEPAKLNRRCLINSARNWPLMWRWLPKHFWVESSACCPKTRTAVRKTLCESSNHTAANMLKTAVSWFFFLLTYYLHIVKFSRKVGRGYPVSYSLYPIEIEFLALTTQASFCNFGSLWQNDQWPCMTVVACCWVTLCR